ncbi:MAG: DNA polymerase III subunit delta [Clostridia bacterium]
MKNIYLLYGEEKYDLYKKLDEIKSKFDVLELNVNYFNLNISNISELDNICNTISFNGNNKLIVIKNTNFKFDITCFESDNTYVVIEDKVDKRLTTYKNISKISEVFEFNFLKEKDMINYVISTFKLFNILIDNITAKYFIDMCGVDKTNILNEMNKLVLFKDNNTITKDDIDLVCVKTLNGKIFDMLDYIIEKKKSLAINILNDLISVKTSPIQVVIMLYKQIKNLYVIKVLKNKKATDINKITKIHPFVFSKLFKIVDNYTEDELVDLISKFDIYDKQTKIR